MSHHVFTDVVELLHPGDALLVNNTRVISARLLGQKETGGRIEVLLVEHIRSISDQEELWNCLARSSKRVRPGTILSFHPDLTGEAVANLEGTVTIRFHSRGNFRETLEQIGRMPLPPYIKRKMDSELETDRDRYQTVFATREGAIAAPTAGLHFTLSLAEQIEKKGVFIVPLTLHIGLGTFLPVRVTRVEDHHMDEEAFEIPFKTAETIDRVKAHGGRIVVVGTSATRALESSVDAHGHVIPGHGKTDLFIYPPFRFRVVDALVTNFHLPGSTLLMLVSAFAGKHLILKAYKEAMTRGYRFYSYGDAMIIL
jgi:S-adenosylmethionine:tRNA ribosyltransferase-isomerase